MPERKILSGRTDVTRRLIALLDDAGADYRIVEHEPVFTSEQAAEERGTALEEGAKALVVKADEQYYNLVMSAAKRVDNGKLREILGTRRVRFARPEELHELTECWPGAVPPFGSLFDLPTLLDESLTEMAQVSFNAGSHTVSVVMPGDDFRRALDARTEDFAE
jgi:Ala-tRNA(Pro) deacylase